MGLIQRIDYLSVIIYWLVEEQLTLVSAPGRGCSQGQVGHSSPSGWRLATIRPVFVTLLWCTVGKKGSDLLVNQSMEHLKTAAGQTSNYFEKKGDGLSWTFINVFF